MLVPRYIMVGGFLGAGKTTAILRMAKMLQSRGERVGLITNDQSVGLVDTAMLVSHGFPTEEITGGCFCCRFDSLVEAAEKLRDQTQPSVFVAEPVGSCTDLRATVAYPLAQMYGNDLAIAPFSVLVDPIRAQRILGLSPGKMFSTKVRYIYEKQLEEADLIIINKTDLLRAGETLALADAIRTKWPRANVMTIAAGAGTGMEAWLDAIMEGKAATTRGIEIDYDVYADGEALLVWVNLQANVTGSETDGNRWLLMLAAEIQSRLSDVDADIAHLKITLIPLMGHDIAVANLVRDGSQPELSHELAEPLDGGQLLVNLRAEVSPETLRGAVLASLRQLGAATTLNPVVTSVEAFRPGRPTPTYRLTP